MNIFEIEENLKALCNNIDKTSFIYNLLLIYDQPKASITRLQKGNLNLSKAEGEIDWKKKLYFKSFSEKNIDLHVAITNIQSQLRHDERFIIVTDFYNILANDTKTGENLESPIKELYKHYDFFLPWAGIEKAEHKSENPADIKAARKMAKLFDEIKADNPDLMNYDEEKRHDLNIFLTRLLFCFFAECTGIFRQKQFTNAFDSETKSDGSDLHIFFERLYAVLDRPNTERKELPDWLNSFPYVNGKLFTKKIHIPHFTARSRSAIISGGELDWSTINPDILGSMFQAVISVEQRSDFGQHYTSVPNIMKVIEPLFLNDLKKEFEEAKAYKEDHKDNKKLDELLVRLGKIKIFDPACGSGNFLIIAYKELCRLEMAVIEASNSLALSCIKLENFYGIEIDDFACEISQLSLYLAEHQMNMEFKSIFGRTNPTLPLQKAGNIVKGNATRIDWESVCPKTKDYEIYLLGNPPYVGARMQSEEQKNDMTFVFNHNEDYKDSDYITAWFLKASSYIKDTQVKYAFVSTNSICQGEQVSYLWSRIFDMGQEIAFAYQSFKWTNNATNNAGVTCVIVGVQNKTDSSKILYTDSGIQIVKSINQYLVAGKSVFITLRKEPLSPCFPKIVQGNMPRDDGNLICSREEKLHLCEKYPNAAYLFRRLYGAQELIQGTERWAIWIEDADLDFAKSIPELNKRIENVYKFRIASKAKTTNGYAKIPHKFAQRCENDGNAVIVPRVTSEKRPYVPIGILDKNSVIIDSANAIYNAEPYLFSIITSKMHMVWLRSVGGKLEERLRYSSGLVYNTFPFPKISTNEKEALLQCTMRILSERERYFGKTLAYLYNPDTMPENLLQAHKDNDWVVEQCYRAKPFESDEERLEYLFKQYEQMTEAERVKNTLFDDGKKKRR